MTKKEDTVTVYPSPFGGHFDGVPHIVQEVTPEEAEKLTAAGVFTTELPEGYVINEAGELVTPEQLEAQQEPAEEAPAEEPAPEPAPEETPPA